MRLSTGPICGSGLAVALVAAGVTGCADNESSLFVRQVQAMEAPDCTVTADPSAAFMPYGSLDLIIGGDNGYQAALLVGNQLAQRGSTDQIRTETARVSLRGAIVRVLDNTGAEVISSFTVDGSGFVDPGSGGTPGFGLLGTTLIPPDFAAASDGYLGWVTVWVKVFGRTLGGKDIESNELSYPIDICSGCLVSFPSKAVTTGGVCTHAGSTEYTIPCIPGQDQPVPCTYCMDYLDICKQP
jgi:hypothetical protein